MYKNALKVTDFVYKIADKQNDDNKFEKDA